MISSHNKAGLTRYNCFLAIKAYSASDVSPSTVMKPKICAYCKENRKPVTIDSTTVVNNSFSFTGKTENPGLYFCKFCCKLVYQYIKKILTIFVANKNTSFSNLQA